ncbi:hypothetical protein SAMN05192558_109280 [Actinokineospora alba]|uniref:DUF8017 domain-containing protein n=1 Tax=Actinokineospora alba TaxID=504798 RepID=A0A1H0T5H0_9PSEU|nr:hypothetical protein C8E96_1861 [Actinokineospora alba]SDJ22821.1 hypothetical protein SAMN05421871_11195 [Actinokineospora alba]SDP49293.1 hypothetical protein SAMN05192558_109280 [Actinokineospora alba]
MPATLSIIAIIAIVGTVIAIGVINRNGGTPEAVPALTPAPATRSAPPSTSSIVNTPARLTYAVPTDWVASNDAVEVLGVSFTGVAEYGVYDCAGTRRSRARVVGAAAQSKSAKPLDPESTAAAFAKAFADTYYPGARVDSPATESTLVDGKKAVVVTAKISPKAAEACLPKDAEVTVLATGLGDRGAALLVVTNDLAGGPDSPKSLPGATTRKIIESARRN